MTTPSGTTTTTEPPSMPHPNEDPDFAAARQAKTTYRASVEATRAILPSQTTELARAEKISEAHTAYTNELRAAADRLQARRETRHNWLVAQLPVGHGIADDATPADRTALMAAFRGHYEHAKGLDHAGRAQMLDAADRFGDEPARRAALTAILESAEGKTLERRPDRYAAVSAHVDEIIRLKNPDTIVRGFQRLAFSPEKTPNEVLQLPYMREQQEKADAAALRQQHRGYR